MLGNDVKVEFSIYLKHVETILRDIYLVIKDGNGK